MSDAQTPRRALLWALGAYLEPDAAGQAAELWQAPSGTSMLVGLSRYCRQVAVQFGLQGKEAELHLRIIRAMQNPRAVGADNVALGSADERGPDPARPSQAGVPSANDSVPPGRASMVVERFLQAVEQAVAREAPALYSPQRWRHAVLTHAGRIPRPLLHQAAAWLWGRTDHLQGDWPARGAGTWLINAAYVALAEWAGPVRADACFTSIVRDFEAGAEPALIGVRKYL